MKEQVRYPFCGLLERVHPSAIMNMAWAWKHSFVELSSEGNRN